jgi:FixJ family two-component response regulator
MVECATLALAEGRRSKAVEVRVGPRFVHIVEDNATFRKTIEGRLEQFGYEVSTYPSAQHLLDRLPIDNVPSCILLDVRLPGMSGPPDRTWFDAAHHIPHWVL